MPSNSFYRTVVLWKVVKEKKHIIIVQTKKIHLYAIINSVFWSSSRQRRRCAAILSTYFHVLIWKWQSAAIHNGTTRCFFFTSFRWLNRLCKYAKRTSEREMELENHANNFSKYRTARAHRSTTISQPTNPYERDRNTATSLGV